MAIVPDDKDWTWVLERPCPECGYDASAQQRRGIGAALRANATTWAELLSGPGAEVRRRPSPDVWSVLEYGCHVRDVFDLYDHRLRRMLDEDDPLYANWDQDVTAVEQDYGAQDPTVVAVEVVAAGTRLGDRFDAIDEAGWGRPGRRSDGARFSVDSFSRYLLHDVVHHVHDVT